jgi:hypothetical protein
MMNLTKLQEDLAKLFTVWADCTECQYNSYICSHHINFVEPLLVAEGKRRHVNVQDFQVSEEPEND